MMKEKEEEAVLDLAVWTELRMASHRRWHGAVDVMRRFLDARATTRGWCIDSIEDYQDARVCVDVAAV